MKRSKGRPLASWDVKTKVECAGLTEMMEQIRVWREWGG